MGFRLSLDSALLNQMWEGDPTLTELSLIATPTSGLNAMGVRALATVLPKSKLTKLTLSDTVFVDPGVITALAAALPNSSLLELGLHRFTIDNSGAAIIASAMEKSPLTCLNLDDNNIGDEGAAAIASALKNSPLTSLNLEENYIHRAGAKTLAEALPHSQLTTLKLRGNAIDSEGFNAIVDALPYSRVTELSIDWYRKNRGVVPDGKSVEMYARIDAILAENKARAARGEDPPALPGTVAPAAPTPVIAEISPAQRIHAAQREEARGGVGGF